MDDQLVVHLHEPSRPPGPLGAGAGLLAASDFQLRLKRTTDVLGSLLLILLLVPVFVLLAFAVKATSRGPVLYWSNRVGQDGRPIRIAKFRSMFIDSEERLAALVRLNDATGPVFKIRDDPRITRFGGFLRKLSLDELPQLVSVLKGDMSLVGPRPALPAEVSTYTELERQRLLVRPGLTCIWQVSGRSDLDFDTWMAMDLEYIRRWSIALDVSLLLRTVPAVILGRGAY